MTAIHSGHLLGFGAAFAASLLLTPIFGKISSAVGLIDYPSSKRFHLTSMPMMGGVAIAFTFLIIHMIQEKGMPTAQFVGIMAAAVFLMVVGLVDDFRSISPKFKMIGQLGAGCILYFSGLSVHITGVAPADFVLTLIWVAGIVNCLNLLDNIDGLSAGAAAISGCCFFIAAAITGKPELAAAAAIFSGACMGFLFHNYHPATIFSGDAGSMFMGCMLAAFGLSFMKTHGAVSQLFPGVILGLLVFDTGLVTVMRKLHGKSITDGGKDHTSHRLCYLGFSIQGSVITLFGVSFLFGAAGILMLLVNPITAILIPMVLLFASLITWYFMRNLYDYGSKPV
jgi:UDP-GlcNAc:undecaprenyl-phosphate/decaprenyl-phosphate GlcNAc-1-phosphate transferase